MECHEGVKMIKTFRGKLTNGAQDTISLHTNDGSTGYRIVKFQVMAPDGSENIESVVQIFTVFQTAGASQSIDFSNQTLLVDYTASINYYIELEQIKLDMNANTVATLKDIRNVTAP